MPTSTVNLPEQGQLVQVRSRQWIVNEVNPNTLALEFEIIREDHGKEGPVIALRVKGGKREAETVTVRFTDPQLLMFPVAVTYLVPEKLAGGM